MIDPHAAINNFIYNRPEIQIRPPINHPLNLIPNEIDTEFENYFTFSPEKTTSIRSEALRKQRVTIRK